MICARHTSTRPLYIVYNKEFGFLTRIWLCVVFQQVIIVHHYLPKLLISIFIFSPCLVKVWLSSGTNSTWLSFMVVMLYHCHATSSFVSENSSNSRGNKRSSWLMLSLFLEGQSRQMFPRLKIQSPFIQHLLLTRKCLVVKSYLHIAGTVAHQHP